MNLFANVECWAAGRSPKKTQALQLRRGVPEKSQDQDQYLLWYLETISKAMNDKLAALVQADGAKST